MTHPSPEYEQALASGAAHLRERRLQEAQAAFMDATQRMPGAAAGWRGLGVTLHALGQADAANAAHLRALQASADDPVLAAAGRAVAANRMAEAYPLLRDRLQAEPDDIAALRIMADMAMRMGRFLEAARMLRRAIEIAPGFAAAREGLSEALFQAPRAAALAEIEGWLAQKPNHLGLLNLKAALLDRSGDYAGAIAIYRQMLTIDPEDFSVFISLGHTLQTIGRIKDSIDAYRRATVLYPTGGEAWWSLSNLKVFRFEADDLAHMRALLTLPDIDADDRLHIEFALGKALEDDGDYADSFAHYAAGNRLRRARTNYNPVHAEDQHTRAARLYTPAFFAERAGAGNPAPDPIFVVGLPRSGSTLVEQILSSHAQVEGTMELSDLLRIVRQLDMPGGRYPEALAALPSEKLAAAGEDYLRATRAQRKTDRPYFIDKLPGNFMHVGLIAAILPNAKIIDTRRHPMSCGWSCFKQHFARGHDFSYDLAELGSHYRTYVDFMALWDRVLPGRVHRVFYENMVRDTEGETRRLLDYLNLPFDPACLRFHETRRAVRTPSAEQVRQPIFTTGLDQWRHFEPWLDPLRNALGDVLDTYPAVPVGLR